MKHDFHELENWRCNSWFHTCNCSVKFHDIYRDFSGFNHDVGHDVHFNHGFVVFDDDTCRNVCCVYHHVTYGDICFFKHHIYGNIYVLNHDIDCIYDDGSWYVCTIMFIFFNYDICSDVCLLNRVVCSWVIVL